MPTHLKPGARIRLWLRLILAIAYAIQLFVWTDVLWMIVVSLILGFGIVITFLLFDFLDRTERPK